VSHRRKKRFGKREPGNEEMVLQITSMADIFTILLVFLLKSFSTGVSNITPAGTVMLPEAQASDEVADVLKVEISPDTILIDEKPVTQLSGFQFDSTDLEADGTSRSFNAALIKVKLERGPASAPEGGAEDAGPKLMILADQKTPYSTLKAVMTAAGNNGYLDFKFAVVGEN
jgi:biopolymer transport protein ExbD